MKKNTYYIDQLKNYFKDQSAFTLNELFLFYQIYDTEINLAAIKMRINRLIAMGALNRIGRGIYKTGNQKLFVPFIDNKLKSIYKQIRIQFPDLKFCIWHTSWFAEFMIHQPAIFYTIIEVESDSEQRTLFSQSVFDFLKEYHKNIYHKPDSVTIQNYVSENRNSIIVLPMISETPLQKSDKMLTATLEKMLVDVFCDETLFAAQQGSEKVTIFKEAFTKYTINIGKLMRYANRRTKKHELSDFIKLLNIKN